MIVKTALETKDYLTYQLFIASRSKQVQNSRIKTRIVVPIVWIILGCILSYHDGNFMMLIAFSFASMLWYIMIPRYETKRYEKHYAKFIEEHYTNRIGQENIIDFQDDIIKANSPMGESKVHYDALLALQELKEYLFLALSKSTAFIIPKKDIDDIEKLKYDLARKTGLSWEDYRDWKWR